MLIKPYEAGARGISRSWNLENANQGTRFEGEEIRRVREALSFPTRVEILHSPVYHLNIGDLYSVYRKVRLAHLPSLVVVAECQCRLLNRLYQSRTRLSGSGFRRYSFLGGDRGCSRDACNPKVGFRDTRACNGHLSGCKMR